VRIPSSRAVTRLPSDVSMDMCRLCGLQFAVSGTHSTAGFVKFYQPARKVTSGGES